MNRPGNAAPLLAAGAYFHPEPHSRQVLQRELETWLAALGVRDRLDGVRALIASESGTDLEPFKLSKADLECAAALATAALCTDGGPERFRIVSRDSSSAKGGMVITRSLKTYYLEGYAFGKHRMRTFSGSAFYPALVPAKRSVRGCGKYCEGSIVFDDRGFLITASWPFQQEDPSTFARKLQMHSYLLSNGKPLEGYGMRFQIGRDRIEIVSGSAESQIKVMALMAQQAVIVIRDAPRTDSAHQIMLGLKVVETERANLAVAALSTEADYAWFEGRYHGKIALSDEGLLALEQYFPLHADYLDWVADRGSRKEEP